ncbi:MAG: hypothetical protein ACTH2Q_14270 [Propionibacteriaceae bacterium]
MDDQVTTEPRQDVQSLVTDFLAGPVVAEYEDLTFLRPDGVLELDHRRKAITAVKLQLPAKQYLHLRSVIIDADGLDDPIAQTTRTASSTWKGYGKALGQGWLFDPDSKRAKGFHTGADARPWVRIDFDAPVDLRRITVQNASPWARARGLQVLVGTADGAWETLYDGAARLASFRTALEKDHRRKLGNTRIRLPGRKPVAMHPAAGDLLDVLAAVYTWDHAGAESLLKTVPDLADGEKAAFRDAISNQVLKEREVEWIAHGIRRSFRFWSEEERRRYIEYTAQVVEDLREVNENVCFGFGAALAVVRDKDLIPHDDDLDVIIGFDPDQAGSLAEGLDLVTDCLTAKGYTVAGTHMAHRWVTKPGQHKIDVFAGLFEGERIAWYPGKRGALTREMMFPTSAREMLGVSCALPRDPEEYLAQVYGPGWVSPDPHHAHTWGRKPYADIAK